MGYRLSSAAMAKKNDYDKIVSPAYTSAVKIVEDDGFLPMVDNESSEKVVGYVHRSGYVVSDKNFTEILGTIDAKKFRNVISDVKKPKFSLKENEIFLYISTIILSTIGIMTMTNVFHSSIALAYDFISLMIVGTVILQINTMRKKPRETPVAVFAKIIGKSNYKNFDYNKKEIFGQDYYGLKYYQQNFPELFKAFVRFFKNNNLENLDYTLLDTMKLSTQVLDLSDKLDTRPETESIILSMWDVDPTCESAHFLCKKMEEVRDALSDQLVKKQIQEAFESFEPRSDIFRKTWGLPPIEKKFFEKTLDNSEIVIDEMSKFVIEANGASHTEKKVEEISPIKTKQNKNAAAENDYRALMNLFTMKHHYVHDNKFSNSLDGKVVIFLKSRYNTNSKDRSTFCCEVAKNEIIRLIEAKANCNNKKLDWRSDVSKDIISHIKNYSCRNHRKI